MTEADADAVDAAAAGRPAVFVDRDNTLIEDPGYLRHAEQVRLLDGVPQALNRLRAAGYPVVVVTNQSGIARGYLTEEELAAIHKKMTDLLAAQNAAVDAIYYCPYLGGPDAIVEKYCRDSDLRKPRPGMLLLAAKEMGLDLASSWLIGDSDRDMQAGKAAGCRTILIGNNSAAAQAEADFVADDLADAVELLFRRGDWEAAAVGRTARHVPPSAPPTAIASPSQGPAPPATKDRRDADAPHQVSTPAQSQSAFAPGGEPSTIANAPTGEKEQEMQTVAEPTTQSEEKHEELKAEAETKAASPPAVPIRPTRQQPSESLVESRLTEIIDELRAMRREARYTDFSIGQLAGAVAQALALCAVGWGLYSAMNGESAAALVRIVVGIAFQLMALTGFAFGRKK